MYFMLGDINTMTLWGIDDNNPFGYLAESRHRTELVGFETARREDGELVFKGFDAKQNVSPFLPPVDTTYSFLERDYSNRRFLRMLKQGPTGKAVERCLKTLPQLNCDVFIRRYFFFESRNEIAARYGISEAQVSVRLSRARKKLADYLRQEGYV